MFGSLHTLTFTKDEFGLGVVFCNKLQLCESIESYYKFKSITNMQV